MFYIIFVDVDYVVYVVKSMLAILTFMRFFFEKKFINFWSYDHYNILSPQLSTQRKLFIMHIYCSLFSKFLKSLNRYLLTDFFNSRWRIHYGGCVIKNCCELNPNTLLTQKKIMKKKSNFSGLFRLQSAIFIFWGMDMKIWPWKSKEHTQK